MKKKQNYVAPAIEIVAMANSISILAGTHGIKGPDDGGWINDDEWVEKG